MKTIGQMIKKMRTEKGINQTTLAKKLGIARSTLSLYESDKRIPTEENKYALCDFFNVDMSYLYGMSDVKNQSHYNEDIFSFLNEEEMDKVITYARFLYESRKK